MARNFETMRRLFAYHSSTCQKKDSNSYCLELESI